MANNLLPPLYKDGKINPASKPIYKNGHVQIPKKAVTKTVKSVGTGGAALTALTKGDLKTDSATGQQTTRVQRVKQIQQILVNHGYRIKVDGIAGPDTNSALADFHGSKPNSKAWNGGHSDTGAALPVDANKSGTFAVRDGKGNETVVSPTNTDPTGGGNTGITPAQLRKLMGGAGGIDAGKYAVNPDKYAAAQVDEQFGPQIAAANKTIGDATGQAKINLADLTKWFGDASSIASTGAKQAKHDDQAAINDHAQAAQSILSAFGGNAGAGGQSIDNTAQNGNNLLSATMANHSDFNDMLKGLIGDQGATALTQQNHTDQKNIGDMKSALTALIASKAAALTADTAGARQQNLQNLINITQSNNQSRAAKLNEIITMAELPSTLAGAQLKAQNTQSLINSRGTKGAPKNFFVNANANDINNAKAAVIGAVKGKNLTAKQAIAAAIAAQPWKINTPGVAGRVVLPALTLAGYSGITPQMLGLNG